MSNIETVKKYFNRYFKAQDFKESDYEFKSLVRILNKRDKQVKKLNIPVVSNNEVAVCECSNPEGVPVNKINGKWICCVCNRPLAN